MSGQRVVITGLGMITPLGNSQAEFWDSLVQGKSGISYIDRFDTGNFPVKIAAQVKEFNPQDYIPRTEARRMDRFVQYAVAAARIAFEDSGLDGNVAAERIGVWIGSGVGGLETMEKNMEGLKSRGIAGISPFFIPMMIPNMASGQVAITLGAKGPNGCTVTACASGTNSVGEAWRIIQNGCADVMICGGTEAAITPLGVGGFSAMKALSASNEIPAKACRPFERDRDGFVMGEGAGILVLESMTHALERGAKIYGELVGYGCNGDAAHVVQPDEEGTGAALALQMALRTAGLNPEDIDYINAHGTGTRLNDMVETKAIKKVFGKHCSDLAVSSIKAATGHMLGAAGAVELIASVLSLQHNLIPPTLNLENRDPDCDLDYVPLYARDKVMQRVLSESLGFGGHNAALIVQKM